jgi:hypothetical protein
MTHYRTEHLTFERYINWPPSKATDFIAWMQAKVSEIPEQFRDSATIDFHGDEDRGDEITLKWKRPEAPEEAERRIQRAEFLKKNPRLRRPWD